jgi:hypothetical protein
MVPSIKCPSPMHSIMNPVFVSIQHYVTILTLTLKKYCVRTFFRYSWIKSGIRGQLLCRVTLQLTVSQSLCQGIEPILGPVTRYYFLSEGCFLKFAVLSFWDALSDEWSGLSFVFNLVRALY